MMTIGTYILTDKKTGKLYVGSSQDVDKRLERHLYDLRMNSHHCGPLQDIWNKNQHLVSTVVDFETREEAYELEQAIIAEYIDTGDLLNIGLGVRGGDNLTMNPRREEIIAKMKESLAARYSQLTAVERRLIWGRSGSLNGMFGKNHTEDVKAALSESRKGNQNARGTVRSPEQRAALSEMAKQRIGEKNPFFGKQHSEETKRKLALAKTGVLPTNSRKVEIDGVVYSSATEASRKLGVVTATILNRINSQKKEFEHYKFVQ